MARANSEGSSLGCGLNGKGPRRVEGPDTRGPERVGWREYSCAIMTRTTMTDTPTYTPPKIWIWDKPDGGRYANTNRPIAGSTHEKELPVGRHPLQLYSLATPNGVKVTI